MRAATLMLLGLSGALLEACGGGGAGSGGTMSGPAINTLTVTVGPGPTSLLTNVNIPYVSVKVCVPGSTSRCATVDHVMVDTGSWGLRIMASLLPAGVAFSPETNTGTGNAVYECAQFAAAVTWGPIVTADVTLGGETGQNVPLQVVDDTGAYAAIPRACGTSAGSTSQFDANGVLGVGVFAQDCGPGCVGAVPSGTPIYYGCTGAGVCQGEPIALSQQVGNPVADFPTDSNGVILQLPQISDMGAGTATGTLFLGIATRANNALGTATVITTDGQSDFITNYLSKAGTLVQLPQSTIDSGTNVYSFNDPGINFCGSGAFIGFYCPGSTLTPSATNVNFDGTGPASLVKNFKVVDPNLLPLTASARAFSDLGGSSSGNLSFVWGLPFFFGRTVYVGLEGMSVGSNTGPFFAY